MRFENITLITALIISTGFLSYDDQRWRVGFLAIMQLFTFIHVVQIWPIALAAVKLISGWIGCLLMGYSIFLVPDEKVKSPSYSSIYFRILIVLLLFVFVLVNVGRLNEWLPVEYSPLFTGLIFLLTGLFGFGLLKDPFNLLLSLLVFLNGFDVVYSSLEGSALVTGIYSLIIVLVSILGVVIRNFLKENE